MKHSNSGRDVDENFSQSLLQNYEPRVSVDEAFSNLYPSYDITLEHEHQKQKRAHHRQRV